LYLRLIRAARPTATGRSGKPVPADIALAPALDVTFENAEPRLRRSRTLENGVWGRGSRLRVENA